MTERCVVIIWLLCCCVCYSSNNYATATRTTVKTRRRGGRSRETRLSRLVQRYWPSKEQSPLPSITIPRYRPSSSLKTTRKRRSYRPPQLVPYDGHRDLVDSEKLEQIFDDFSSSPHDPRRAQQDTTICSMCGINGTLKEGSESLIPEHNFSEAPEGISCQLWNETMTSNFAWDSVECFALIDAFQYQCCQETSTATTTTVATEMDGSIVSSASCSICGTDATLKADFVPMYNSTPDLPPNITCGEWENYTVTQDIDSQNCMDLQLFFPQCCVSTIPPYQCEKTIRDRALNSSVYDSAVPPIQKGNEPFPVTVELTYFHVTEVNEQSGSAEIFVWLTLEWNDPRLAWTPSSNECANQVSMRASINPEATEIWVPDFDLFNQVHGVQKLPDAKATVYSDGTVSWIRNGPLTALCQFTGLAEIPFDTLGCEFLFGVWERRAGLQQSFELQFGKFVQIDEYDQPGLSYGTLRTTYTEFNIIKELSVVSLRANQQDLAYSFYFGRATQHYIYNIIVPTIILTYVSFGTFLLDIQCGERLSYGMALAVVIVAQQIMTVGLIPVSAEQLWMDKFVAWSFYFVILGLLQSVAIAYVHYLGEDRKDAKKLKEGEEGEHEPTTQDHPATQAEEPQPVPTGVSVKETSSGNTNESLAQANDNSSEEMVDDVDNEALPIVTEHNQSKMQRLASRVRQVFKGGWSLRKVDYGFFIVMMVLYTAFWIIMFATLPIWARNEDSTNVDVPV